MLSHPQNESNSRSLAGAISWSPDLGSNVGSASWFGELVLLTGLIAFALSWWPTESASSQLKVVAITRNVVSKSNVPGLISPAAGASPISRHFLRTRTNESLKTLLQRSGIPNAESEEIDSLVAAAIFPDRIAPGTQVAVQFSSTPMPDGRLQIERAELRPRLNLALSLVREAKGFTLVPQAIIVEMRTVRLRGRIGPNLAASIADAGGTRKYIDQFRQAMGRELDLARDFAPDDVFDMVVTERRAADGRTEPGEVVYAAVRRGSTPSIELLRWGSAGEFHKAGTIGRAGPDAMWPVNGRFTSGYGVRYHPVLGYQRMHEGIDIGAPWGSPIYAVAGGVVTFAGRHGGHGNFVRLAQQDGDGSGYAHLSRIAVSAGQSIVPGQVLGFVGSTGLSTGPHLHFEVYRKGRTVNPLSARPPPGSLNDRKFAAAVAALKALSPLRSR